MKLYVGNVPYQATEAELQDWFSQAGVRVDHVDVIRDRFSGEPRGFAFAEINNDEDAARAIQSCNGRDFQGRTLVVNEARPPREGSRGAGGGGGGGGRGRGGRGGGGGGGGHRREW